MQNRFVLCKTGLLLVVLLGLFQSQVFSDNHYDFQMTNQYPDSSIPSQNYFAKLKLSELKLDSLKKCGTNEELIRVNRSLADICHFVGYYRRSLEYWQEVMRLTEEGNGLELAFTWQKMGDLYHFLSEYDMAIKYYQKAINGPSDSIIMVNSLRGLGHIYRLQKNFDQALSNYSRALEFIPQDDPYASFIRILRDKAKLYHAMGRYSQSLQLHLEALKLIDQFAPHNNYAKSGSYLELAALLLDSGEYHQANQYAWRSNELAQYLGHPEHQKEASFILYKSYLKLGNERAAIEQLENHTRLKDSLLNVNKLHQIKELEARYQTSEHEKEIALLQKDGELKELKIKRNRILLAVMVLLLILLTIIGVTVYRQTRLKASRNEIELGLRLLRSQMNPHFIFNSLMAVQRFIYKNNKTGASEYLAKFSRLVRLILENSRQELISLEQELQTLEFYLEMQNLRFENQFQYSMHIDPEIEPDMYQIPPMLAQPFIENAIEHGLLKKEDRGELNIRYRLQDEFMLLEIEDNGVGIQSDQSKKEHQSLAIQMTNERIKLLNKGNNRKVSLHINTGLEQGVKVELKLPLSLVQNP